MAEPRDPSRGWIAVASAGGHLAQLLELRRRIADTEPTWVTYDTPQARSLLGEAETVWAHHPTTKHLPNAARNYGLARSTFREREATLVVSTGAAVAVPFLLQARQLGIPCHYIESATRVTGPSLSGRILEQLRGVHLYRQLGAWGGPRWQQGPCVFDGFHTVATEPRPVERVVVSLGTHRFPFPRLLQRLAECFRGSATDVVWQLGSTPDPGGLPGTVLTTIPSDRLSAELAAADAVVGHAGVGLTLASLRAGKVPILVPRRRSYREHTDDHQSELAHELGRRGLAIDTDTDRLDLDSLRDATARRVAYELPPPFDLPE